MDYKFIFKGRLDFGNKRSFDNVLNMYDWKVTNHYKKDIQFDEEELFDLEQYSASFPRSLVIHGTKKNFFANSDLLAYLSEFAISGQMEMWMIEERAVKHYRLVEPKGDRAAINSFTKGRALSVSEGKGEEAIAALDIAIQKYEKHAQAYERRAFVNTMLEKYHEADRDYTKSINIYAGAPEPYYGRGLLNKIQSFTQKAVEDFDTSIKRSIPLQPIHWKSRRRKAEALIELNEYADAAKELKFFTIRKHAETDPNFKYLRKAHFDYGYCQYKLGEHEHANELFDKALTYAEGKDAPGAEELLYYRGMARHKAGLPDFEADLKKAAKAGNPKAKAALELVS